MQNNWVSFLDKPVQIEQEINYTPATNTNSQNLWQMPSAINLGSSGLCPSSRTEVLKRWDKVYSYTTQVDQDYPLHSASKMMFQICLGAILF
jgi:hypothetical protein